jgi:hypothetical protein
MAGPGEMAGPGDELAAAEGRGRGGLRASHADREQVIGTLKAAFVQGRLTRDELDARVDRVYASRTYAELGEVTADIPAGLTRARSRRDPWRATKISLRVEYAIFVPGIVTFLLVPAGPHTTVREVVTLTAAVYLVFWILGVFMMVASRPAKRPDGQAPPRSAAGAGDGVVSVARELVTRTLEAALAQGRLAEDEYDARVAQAIAARSAAEMTALTADLPAGIAARPPAASDARLGVCVSLAAAGVLAALVVWQPDNYPAFALALFALATLIVVPVITVGLLADVRHQKRSGGR